MKYYSVCYNFKISLTIITFCTNSSLTFDFKSLRNKQSDGGIIGQIGITLFVLTNLHMLLLSISSSWLSSDDVVNS